MPDTIILPAGPRSEMGELCVDDRTGFPVIWNPLGPDGVSIFEGHDRCIEPVPGKKGEFRVNPNRPGGEADGAVRTRIRMTKAEAEAFWRDEVDVDENGHPAILDVADEAATMVRCPRKRFAPDGIRSVKRSGAFHVRGNVYDQAMVALPQMVFAATRAEHTAAYAALNTRLNAVLTVGAGKTHATINNAHTAASDGDQILCYATAGNTYAERCNFTKAVYVAGMVVDQGLKIQASAWHRISNTLGVFENFFFECTVASSMVCITTTAGMLWKNCIATGGLDGFKIQATTTMACLNCLAYGNAAAGFYSYYADQNQLIHCTACKNGTYGFWGRVADYGQARNLLAAGNSSGDYLNMLATKCMHLVSADGSATGIAAETGFLTTDFEDYANDDFRIRAAVKDTTKARFLGLPILVEDYLAETRKREGVFYVGAHDPDPIIADYPDVGNVTEDDTVDGVQGTYHETVEGEVKAGVGFGAGGSEYSGTVTLPPEADVALGVDYGAGGSEYTGILDPDFPAVGNVTQDDTVDGVQGTYHETVVADVKNGVWFGEDGTEYEGEYTPSIPSFTIPTLSVADDGDASVTIAVGNNAGQTSRIKYWKTGDTAWTLGPTVVGNGTSTALTGLAYGTSYTFIAVPYDAATGVEGAPSLPFFLALLNASAVATSGQYRVTRIDRMPGTSTKTIILEKVGKPREAWSV